jgi:uncharacterized phage protein (TIGR01671 family)
MIPCCIDETGMGFVRYKGPSFTRDHAVFTEPIADGVNAYVMQSTGCLDSKGVEIFEGDVVQHAYGTFGNGTNGTVVFAFGEWAIEDDEGALDRPVVPNAPKLTVIGNIHENPELVGR